MVRAGSYSKSYVLLSLPFLKILPKALFVDLHDEPH